MALGRKLRKRSAGGFRVASTTLALALITTFLSPPTAKAAFIGWDVGAAGTILHSSNGTTWASQTSGTTNTLNDVVFIDPLNGWAVGVNGTGLRTQNGGSTWIAAGLPATDNYNAVDFTGSLGLVVSAAGKVYRSTDAGVNFFPPMTLGTASLSDVEFASSTTAYIISADGKVYRSTDTGLTFSFAQVDPNDTSALTDVEAIDKNTLFVTTADGKLYRSTDAGSTFGLRSQVTTTGALTGVEFIGGTSGWVITSDGKLFHTTDAGATFGAALSLSSSALRGIEFVDPMDGWIVGDGGLILESTDGGSTWGSEASGTNQNLLAVQFVVGPGPNTVPEPASLVLLATAFLGFTLIHLSRTKAERRARKPGAET